MKKVLSALLVLAMLLALCACNAASQENDPTETDANKGTDATAATDDMTDPTEATDPSEETTEPVVVDPMQVLEEFVNGWWAAKVANAAVDEYGDTLTSFYLDTSEASIYGYMTYYTNNPHGDQVFDQVIHEGKTYLNISFSGSMGDFTFEVLDNGNVKVELMTGTVIELARVTEKEYKIASSNDEVFLPVGTVFVDQYKLNVG